MEEDEGGVLRVTEDQEWLDNMLSYTHSIATIISEIKAYDKLMSEVNYFETGDTTLIAIKDRLVNIRTTLNTMLSRVPSLIGGRFPITDCLTERVKTQRIKVTNTPTPLPTNPLPGRRLLIIFNNSNATIYYGESDVSGGQGMPLFAGQPVSIDARASCKFYAVVSSSDVAKNVRILEGK